MMGLQKLYIDGTEVPRRRFDDESPVEYSVQEGRLTIYWPKRKRVLRARLGEIYYVSYGEELQEVCRMLRPGDPKDVLMWLLGFRKRVRYHGRKGLLPALRRWRQACEAYDGDDTKGWVKYYVQGDDYEFLVYRNRATDELHYVAAYISERSVLDKHLVREILAKCRWELDFPRPYVEKTLCEVFGFTSEDLAKIALR